MLRSRPNMAAAMESSTSSVRTCTSSVPPLIGVMRMPASAARRAAQRPRERRQPLGASAVELEQRRVVHHGPHGHAGPGALEEQADADGDEHTAAEGDGLVIGDVDAEDLELGRVAEEEAGRSAARPGSRSTGPARSARA